MPVIERYSDAPFEIYHNGVLVAVVYDNHILLNSAEKVEVVFGDKDSNQWKKEVKDERVNS